MTWLLVTRCPLRPAFWRFWASFPGFHIAQFTFQVIGNCGVICFPRHNAPQYHGPPRGWRTFSELSPQLTKLRIVFGLRAVAANGHWCRTQYDGIVAETDARVPRRVER